MQTAKIHLEYFSGMAGSTFDDHLSKANKLTAVKVSAAKTARPMSDMNQSQTYVSGVHEDRGWKSSNVCIDCQYTANSNLKNRLTMYAHLAVSSTYPFSSWLKTPIVLSWVCQSLSPAAAIQARSPSETNPSSAAFVSKLLTRVCIWQSASRDRVRSRVV